MKSKGLVERIEFRESTHRYFYNGTELIGVTTVFRVTGIVDFSKVKTEVIEPALVIGDYVHEMARLFGLGKLDEDDIDPSLRGYLFAIKNFYANEVKTPLLIEQPVCDPYNGYCGTPDIVYEDHKGAIVVDDFKTPKKPHPAWGHQTAAYKNAVQKSYDNLNISKRGGVLLKEDGTYDRHPHRKATDFDYFLAELKIARFKQEHRIKT